MTTGVRHDHDDNTVWPEPLSGTSDRAGNCDDYPHPTQPDPEELRVLMEDMERDAQHLREAMLATTVTMREAIAGMEAFAAILRDIDWSDVSNPLIEVTEEQAAAWVDTHFDRHPDGSLTAPKR